jgi:hypothetical protein
VAAAQGARPHRWPAGAARAQTGAAPAALATRAPPRRQPTAAGAMAAATTATAARVTTAVAVAGAASVVGTAMAGRPLLAPRRRPGPVHRLRCPSVLTSHRRKSQITRVRHPLRQEVISPHGPAITGRVATTPEGIGVAGANPRGAIRAAAGATTPVATAVAGAVAGTSARAARRRVGGAAEGVLTILVEPIGDGVIGNTRHSGCRIWGSSPCPRACLSAAG